MSSSTTSSFVGGQPSAGAGGGEQGGEEGGAPSKLEKDGSLDTHDITRRLPESGGGEGRRRRRGGGASGALAAASLPQLGGQLLAGCGEPSLLRHDDGDDNHT